MGDFRHTMRVRDLMSAPPVCVAPDLPLKQVADVLVAHAISGVPVVEDERLVGIVSESDIVAREQSAEGEDVVSGARLGRLRRRIAPRRVRTARDVMSSPPLTVTPDVSAVGAARLMTAEDVSRLAVVEDERLLGVVTRSDLVRAFVRSDEEIRREIVSEILPALLVSENDVEVIVDNGVVGLSGEVEDEVEVRCLPHAVRGVAGVVDVVPLLTARHSHTAFDRLSEQL